MPQLLFLQWMMSLTGTVFCFMFGAVCGSFINVLVYRLPRGMSVVRPPSTCPKCNTRLTWRENFPVLGWLRLRGRCRYCETPISPEYVIIEVIVGLLFAALWVLWFFQEPALQSIGISLEAWRPDWTSIGAGRMLPTLIAVLTLVGALVAITLIDARTFMIPLVIPWFATVIGLVFHPLHAWWMSSHRYPDWIFTDYSWVIPAVPTDRPELAAAIFLGTIGIALSILLMRVGVLRQSFADYDEWERSLPADVREKLGLDPIKDEAEPEEATSDAAPNTPDPPSTPEPPAERGGTLRSVFMRAFFLTGPAVAFMGIGFSVGMRLGKDPIVFMLAGMLLGLLVGIPLRKLAADGDDPDSNEPVWVQYPHARREMGVELLFLAPCLLLGALGWWLASPGGPLHDGMTGLALPLRVLAGALGGYLVGGGVIWGVRIFGTLLFGKEAMGLGDVHLLAAVGATLGWISPLLAFFTALFLGIGWAILSVFFARFFNRHGTALPFGPHLAIGAMMTLYMRPFYEFMLAAILNQSVTLP